MSITDSAAFGGMAAGISGMVSEIKALNYKLDRALSAPARRGFGSSSRHQAMDQRRGF